jgi:hypothetical protein
MNVHHFAVPPTARCASMAIGMTSQCLFTHCSYTSLHKIKKYKSYSGMQSVALEICPAAMEVTVVGTENDYSKEFGPC